MITGRSYAIRPAETDADLEEWTRVRRVVQPDDPPPSIELLKAEASPDRLLVLVESAGEIVGSGLADRSQTTGSYVAPRILPDHRRRGAGTAVLRHLMDHAASRGFTTVGGHAEDDGALAFATRHGFEEVDRQVEQVRRLSGREPPAPPDPPFDRLVHDRRGPARAAPARLRPRPPGLSRTWPFGPGRRRAVDAWLREEATCRADRSSRSSTASSSAMPDCSPGTATPSRAENGLTVVDRRWRGRGLATALKRRQLAWAAANGIREVVTWTQARQRGDAAGEPRLGYETRTISHTMRRDLA